MTIQSVYQDVARDSVYKDENGFLDFNMFNRMSKRGENRLQDWLTGGVDMQKPPVSFSNQKIKDWLSPFLTPYKVSLDADGKFKKPADYYYFDGLYSLNLKNNDCKEEDTDCGENNIKKEIEKDVIRIFDGDRFNQKIKTKIKGAKPTPSKAIAKEMGDSFEIYPKEVAGVVLEYIRLPKYAAIVTRVNTTLNDVEIDPTASTDYEWGEGCREALIYFITDSFANHISSATLKQMNNLSNASNVGK